MVDSTDLQLIKLLQEDAYKSSDEFAKKLGVSSSTVRRRIQSLIEQKVIKITAQVNPVKLGYEIIALIAFDVDPDHLDGVLETLEKRADIHLLIVTAGRYDAVAFIWATSTNELYTQLKEIAKIEGIKNAEPFISLNLRKNK
jgi:Lrp/AsnC family transcriptional regulator, regulator for asnA, asnC and gidA